MSSGFQEKCRKLYIGGLVENVLKEDLVRELSKCGEVVDVWVARNPPGFAFAEYVKSSDAEKAVRSLDGVNVCGSRIRVEFAHGGRSKSAVRSAFRGGRPVGRGPLRRRNSPRRSGRNSSYDGHRYPDHDQFSSFRSSEVANAAAVAAAAGFPYGVSAYQSMLPFLPSDDFIRGLQSQSRRRSSPGRIPFPVNHRGRSPISRRRSRSPLGAPVGRLRGRSPPDSYNGRSISRNFDTRGRGGYGDLSRPRIPREPRANYSPPFVREMNGRRDESRGRRGRDDRRRR
ncbi:Serine/arginine-rich splicing factor 7 [Schistosoma japonicum]|nr:Serine/arginine-rich splicing factor 7 [Schistosoma japonicum]